jgi:hypothetical protein
LSSVKPPGAVGGPPGPPPGEEPGASRPAAGSAPAAPASAPADALTPVFDAVARRLASGEITDRHQALRVAVADVLADQMPGLADATRAALVERVAAALEDHPALAPRLARLLDPPDRT